MINEQDINLWSEYEWTIDVQVVSAQNFVGTHAAPSAPSEEWLEEEEEEEEESKVMEEVEDEPDTVRNLLSTHSGLLRMWKKLLT